MQTHSKAGHYGTHPHRATGLLSLALLGAAFVGASFAARLLLADNPLAAEVSAAAGAAILLIPILKSAVADLLAGEMHMNELVALAVLAAMAQGEFLTAGVVSIIMLVSLVIETRTAEGAHASIEGLIRLTPGTAHRLLDDGRAEDVAARDLRPGHRVRVLPGENVPADGTIARGRTTLNESTITGESLPRDKGEGDEVFAGTQNITGAIEVTVSRAGEDTTIGRVRELILAAEKTRLPLLRIVDRYIGYYAPAVLMIAGLVWFFTHELDRVVSLLVVACPCALILATPSAMVAALSAAARLGILVKDVADLEAASHLTAFVLDKTGTLSTGELGVTRLSPREGVTPTALLRAAAAVERFSRHPAAQALARLAAEAGVTPPEAADFHEEPGQGVRASVEGARVLSGRAGWLRANGVSDPLLDRADGNETEGFSVIFVSAGGRYLGWIGLQDEVRPEARQSLAELAALNVKRLVMVTGDRSSVAQRVAEQTGCPEARAQCLPHQKVEVVEDLRAAGYRVAFVGDGVNDAPALSASDTGIAMGAAGSDVAIHSSTVALMSNDLRKLPFLLRLSRNTRNVIYQNLAVGAVFIVGGLAFSGLGWLKPVFAAILHNAGALIVVFNSARLIRSGEELGAASGGVPP